MQQQIALAFEKGPHKTRDGMSPFQILANYHAFYICAALENYDRTLETTWQLLWQTLFDYCERESMQDHVRVATLNRQFFMDGSDPVNAHDYKMSRQTGKTAGKSVTWRNEDPFFGGGSFVSSPEQLRNYVETVIGDCRGTSGLKGGGCNCPLAAAAAQEALVEP